MKSTINKHNIKISERMTGKMTGIPSISTSVLLNPRCHRRAKCEGSICFKCYAASTLKRYGNAEKAYAHNTEVLTERVLERDELPIFANVQYVRLESFGDLINAEQACNCLNIAKHNSKIKFALWTKNPDILMAGFDLFGMKKPDNLQIVYSSPMINKADRAAFRVYDFIDKVFTGYDKEHAKNINCGAKQCATCGLCYEKNNVKYINELLK